MLKYWRISNTVCEVKESRLKRPHFWFYLYETSGEYESIETECTLVITLSWGVGISGQGFLSVMMKWSKIILWWLLHDYVNIIIIIGPQLFTFFKAWSHSVLTLQSKQDKNLQPILQMGWWDDTYILGLYFRGDNLKQSHRPMEGLTVWVQSGTDPGQQTVFLTSNPWLFLPRRLETEKC